MSTNQISVVELLRRADDGSIGWLGPYRVLEVIDADDVDAWLLAEDRTSGERRHLLVCAQSVGSEPAERWLRDMRQAATLDHDDLCVIASLGADEGHPFAVLRVLPGETLAARLAREQWLSLSESLRIGRQLAEGLDALHRVNLAHGHLVPERIWLEEGAEAGSRSARIVFGGGRGSGAPRDFRRDLSDCGAVLEQMIVGKAGSAMPATPMSSDGTIARQLVPGVVLELLAQLRSSEPMSAAEMVQRLRALEHDTMVLAPVIGLRAQSELARRRHFSQKVLGLWLGGIAIGLSGLVGLFMAWGHGLHERANRGASSTTPAPSTTIEPGDQAEETLKVGLLHSLTGPLASIERMMVETELQAIDEINENGGLLGKKVAAVVEDGHSDELAFAERAEKLIAGDKVAVVFGCLHSAARKRVAEVCERHQLLLFYPMNFEGLELSPNVVYVGGGPNQAWLPMIRWAYSFLEPPRRRFFFLGTSSLYSLAFEEIARLELRRLGSEPVGQASIPFGVPTAFGPIIEQLRQAKADVVLDTLDPTSDFAFFQALAASGNRAEDLPVFSMWLGEAPLRQFAPDVVQGHYSPINYWESLPGADNRRFVERYRRAHRTGRITTSMETAYAAVQIWRSAVVAAGSFDTAAVRSRVRGLVFRAPEGPIEMDAATQYGSRIARVGRVTPKLDFDVVYTSPERMPVLPFPPGKDRAGWEAFLDQLYRSFGNRWTKAGP